MKTIPLTKGKFAIVDDEDFDRLMAIGKWQYHSNGYAVHGSRRGKTYMHRVIIDCVGLEVDHRNRDKLDNRKGNLRAATRSQNQQNRVARKNGSTIYKGVFLRKSGRFEAQVKLNGIKVLCKTFDTAEEANHARIAAAVKFHGEFAR